MKKHLFISVLLSSLLLSGIAVAVLLIAPLTPDTQFMRVWLPCIVLLLSALIPAAIVSRFSGEIISRRINSIDPKSPESKPTYRELSPLITKMKNQGGRVAARLRELGLKKAELDEAISHMQEGILIVNHRGDILSHNDRALEILGANTERSYRSVLSLPEDQALRELLARALGGTRCESERNADGRFYRMLGEEGYIQLTLPATMSQHIAAKLIAAVVTTLVTFLFLAVCSSLMAFPAGASWLTDMLRDGYDMVRGGGLSLLLLTAVIALAGMAMGYLHTYLSCAVGSLFPQHRKLASILSFFALQFLAQILFMLAVYFAATRMEVLLNSFSRFALDLLSSPNGEMKAIFGSLIGVSAVEIVIDAVLWLITQTILTRKLNLP